MQPLLFVNWSSENVMFRGLMWVVASVLAGMIVLHLAAMTAPVHHSIRTIR
ncbi:MAG TPA: hypothetical protein VEF89_08590 [Solirubrobacteraceae bacterium]|nr:hypothetical protein [Solirubrobacteraceae bacterium]